jgi:hypothetical protein
MNSEHNFLDYIFDKYWDRIESCQWKGNVYATSTIEKSIGNKRYNRINQIYRDLGGIIENIMIDGEEGLYFDEGGDDFQDYVSITKITNEYIRIVNCVNDLRIDIDYRINLDNLDKVTLEQEGIKLYLLFHSLDGNQNLLIDLARLGGKLRDSGYIICEIINNTTNLDFDVWKNQQLEVEKSLQLCDECVEKEDYESILKQLENIKSISDIDTLKPDYRERYNYYKIFSNVELKFFNEALHDLEIVLSDSNTSDRIRNIFIFMQSYCLNEIGSCQEALISLNNYVLDSSNIEDKKYYLELQRDIYINFNENFLEIPLHKRSVVFVTDSGIQSNELCILYRDNMPPMLQFPNGHPHINALYACHPLNNNLYMPIESYEKQLFEDKVNEFQRLMQALGATESLIVSASEKILIEDSSKVTDVNVEGATKLGKGRASVGTDNKENNDLASYIRLSRKQRHEPISIPYVPDNLVWYQGEIAWQRLAEKRLKGNLLEDEMTLSTSQVENVSKQRLLKIDAELKTLMANVDASYSHNYASSVKSTLKYDCTIKVEFESVNSLREKFGHLKVDEITNEDENLQKYVDEVKFMLDDDGIIDDMERKMLDRKAQSFGLSQEDQKEIENKILYQEYNENEIKYIHEIEEFKKDGEITEMELKMLDRYAIRFNLTEVQKTNLNIKFV